MRADKLLVGGEAEQPNSLSIILRDAAALGIHAAEAGLRSGEPLVGGDAEPSHGLGIVLRDAAALDIAHPEIVLPGSVPLVGSEAIPASSFGKVRFDLTKLVLRVGVGRPAQPHAGGLLCPACLFDSDQALGRESVGWLRATRIQRDWRKAHS